MRRGGSFVTAERVELISTERLGVTATFKERLMKKMMWLGTNCGIAVALLGGLIAVAQNKPAPLEQERKVKEAEVPKAALDALKKTADKATITEFAEEIEHGNKFYEGSWKGPDGNVDALVTEAGDLVEIEEVISAAKVPAPARAAAEKEAGKDTKLTWEKKTLVMYEVHYKKGDKGQEMILTPDGRSFHEEGDDKQDKDEDEEDGK
jgi:hypothetical protein